MKQPLRILSSALKHGITEATIRRVAEAPVYMFELRQEPPKVVLLGIGNNMQPIEVIYVINNDGTQVVIHAMPASKALLNRVQRDRRERR